MLLSRRKFFHAGAAVGAVATISAAQVAEPDSVPDDGLNALLHEHWAVRDEVLDAAERAQESLRRSPVVGYDPTGMRAVGFFEWGIDGATQISAEEAEMLYADRTAAYRSLRAAEQRLADLEKILASRRLS